MLTKILFTALVIFCVYAFYRFRGRIPATRKPAPKPVLPSPIGRIAAYGFIVLLLLISAGIYYIHWQEAHTIVTIRVIDGNGSNVTVYKAYRKSIKGNRFESLNGKSVVLGEAQRVEFIESE